MRRHVIIGSYGSSDRVHIPLRDGEVSTRLDLITSDRTLDYGIGLALNELIRIGVNPTEIGIDLLVLAAHVHAADTRISRSSESQD